MLFLNKHYFLSVIFFICFLVFNAFTIKYSSAGGCTTAPNDDCVNAIALVVNNACVNGNTCGNTELGENTSCSPFANQTVWYSFIATDVNMVVVVENFFTGGCNIGSSVWDGSTGCLPSGLLSCQNILGGPIVQTHPLTGLTVSNTYYVRVEYNRGGLCGQEQEFCIKVSDNIDCAGNDVCGNACPVVLDNACYSSTLEGASDNLPGIGGCQSANGHPEVWFVGKTDGDTLDFTVDNLGAGFTGDIELTVFSGSCGGLIIEGSSCGPAPLNFTLAVIPGMKYWWTISSSDGVNGPNSTFDICVFNYGCPSFTAEAGPDAIICAGSPYTTFGAFIGGGAITSTWTTSGTGTFADSSIVLTDYFPSLADETAGTVTLTITTNDPDGAGPCVATSDSMVLLISQFITSFPYIQNFESQLLCGNTSFSCIADGSCTLSDGWHNLLGDNIDWSVDEGGTPSFNTGPAVDHTTGSVTGNYLFTEASSCFNQTALLTSPCLDITPLINPYLEFWYHMYGAAMGTLYIDIREIGGLLTLGVDIISGDQGNEWQMREIDLSAYSGVIQIIFRGETGSSFTSDMAIDDVKIYDKPPNDVGVIAIDAPNTGCSLSASENITIRVKNFGAEPQDTIPVSYSIGGPPINDTIFTLMAPSDTLSFTFAVTADLSVTGTYIFDVWTTLSTDTNNINDSITNYKVDHLAPVITFPYIENFDAFTPGTPGILLNDWLNAARGDFEWYVNNGTTPTFATGPIADHTTGAGNYMYTEANGNIPARTALLISPCIDISSLANPFLEFWHHMYGFWMGTLYIDIDTGGVWIAGVDSIVGNQGNNWFKREVDLSAFSGIIRVRFRGLTGASISSDMAIDDVKIYDKPPNDVGVVFVGDPNSGCGLSASEPVTIEVENFGLNPQNTIPVSYSVNGGTPVNDTIFVLLNPGNTTVFTFATPADLSTPGTYIFDAWTSLTGDGDNSNDSTMGYQVIHAPPINTFPYIEDFESGTLGEFLNLGEINTLTWVNTGIRGSDPGHSATRSAYFGNPLDTSYNTGLVEGAILTLPCIDLTSLGSVQLSFNYFLETENLSPWDDARVSISTDNITYTTIAGNNIIGNLADPSFIWQALTLDISAYAGFPSVYLRFSFNTGDAAWNDFEGFYIDDINISVIDTCFNLSINSTNVLCFGDSTGTATLIIDSLGTSPYTYIWSDGQTDSIATGLPTGTYQVKVSDANGCTDSANVTILPPLSPLSGTYTIGGGFPDYADFTSAVADLNSRGISAAVTFNVRDGTYTEQITIDSICNVSALNTVVFQSENSDSTLVILTFAANSIDNYTVRLNNADFITFRQMTIAATDIINGRVFVIAGGSSNNKLFNNRITGVQTSSASDDLALIFSLGGAGENNEFRNNVLLDGSYGFDYAVSASESGTVISGNTLINQYRYGMLLIGLNAPEISSNIISTNSSNNFLGIYCSDCDNALIISKNKVTAPTTNGFGILLKDCDGTPGNEGMVSNNFVQIGINDFGWGLYIESSFYQNIYHNSIHITSTDTIDGRALVTTSTGGNLNIVNNIFMNSGGGYAVYIGTPAAIATMDYNDLYTTGTYIGNWGGSNYTTFTQWQDSTLQDSNSISIDPLFNSITDLHANAPALDNAGTNLIAVVSDDIDGEVRPAVPCIGADEFIAVCALSVSITDSANVLCNGDSTGSATVTPGGGTQPYTYLWNDSNAQTDSTATGLSAGNYQIIVNDTNGCVDSAIVSITEPLPIPSTLVFETICDNDSIYLQNAWQVTVGTYDDTLLSVNGCDSLIITNLNVLPVASSIIDTSICQGDSLLAGGAYQTVFGTYFDTIIASNGCDSIITTNLNVLPAASSIINTSICQGDSLLAGGAYQTVSGTYFDTTIASNGCDSIITTNLIINLTYDTTVTVAICQGDSTLLPGGGYASATGIYYDTLAAVNSCDSAITTNLTVFLAFSSTVDTTICQGDSLLAGGAYQTISGTYFDTTIASNGCDSIITTNLNVLPVASSIIDTSICQGDSLLAGGAYQTVSGIYYDTLQASNGCDSVIVTTLSVNLITITITGTDSICPGICDGDATAVASGGGTPFTFIWSNSVTGPTITALCPNTYAVTVTDNNGCTATDSIIIVELPFEDPSFFYTDTAYCQNDSNPTPTVTGFIPGTFSSTGLIINNTTGTIDLAASNLGSYIITYTTGGPCPNNSTFAITILPAPDATIDLAGPFCGDALPDTLIATPLGGTWSGAGIIDAINGIFDPDSAGPGLHTITYIVSNASCNDSDFVEIAVFPIPEVSATGDSIICEGDSTIITLNFTGVGPFDMAYTNGTDTVYGFGIEQGGSIMFNPTVSTTYTLISLTDSLGCPGTTGGTLTITVIPAPPAPVAGTDASYCEGDIITDLTATAGSGGTLTWYDDAGLTNVVGTGTIYTPLQTVGTIIYHVTETVSGCVSSANSVTITIYGSIDAGKDTTICLGESTQLQASGGSDYQWYPVEGLSDPDIAEPLASPSQTTIYYVQVSIGDSCVFEDSIIITVRNLKDCWDIYNTFSPNGDGKNDTWIIDGIQLYEINSVTIFNRWKDVVNEFENYDNKTEVWDGTNKNGADLPDGTYFYIIDIRDEQFTGWVQVAR